MKSPNGIPFEDYEAVINQIRRAHSSWLKMLENPSCDKIGFGFNLDERFSAVKINMSLDSWSGYYGSSSCGTILSLANPELFSRAFVRAVQDKLWELLDATADILQKDSEDLRELEIKRLKLRLQELETKT